MPRSSAPVRARPYSRRLTKGCGIGKTVEALVRVCDLPRVQRRRHQAQGLRPPPRRSRCPARPAGTSTTTSTDSRARSRWMVGTYGSSTRPMSGSRRTFARAADLHAVHELLARRRDVGQTRAIRADSTVRQFDDERDRRRSSLLVRCLPSTAASLVRYCSRNGVALGNTGG